MDSPLTKWFGYGLIKDFLKGKVATCQKMVARTPFGSGFSHVNQLSIVKQD
jgi:hypothetical protein